jgi:hypothetical protein
MGWIYVSSLVLPHFPHLSLSLLAQHSVFTYRETTGEQSNDLVQEGPTFKQMLEIFFEKLKSS